MSSSTGPTRMISRGWLRKTSWTSTKEVLKRRNVRPALIGKVINLIRERAEEIKFRQPAQFPPDPDKNAFCVCAEQGKADSIVTLNVKASPKENPRARVPRPADFLARL